MFHVWVWVWDAVLLFNFIVFNYRDVKSCWNNIYKKKFKISLVIAAALHIWIHYSFPTKKYMQYIDDEP